MALHKNDRWLAVILAVFAVLAVWYLVNLASSGPLNDRIADPKAAKLGTVWVGQTANYEITSWATVDQTTKAGSTAEGLLRAYLQFFALDDKAVPKGGLKLTLYRDRAQFKARHPDPAWAEALYGKGVSYAYFDAKAPNSVHWMLHEATHQLNEQVGHLPKAKWVDEGLASYFGASKFEDYTLEPGKVEAQAYPVWWLGQLRPSGDMQRDYASGRVVPLRALISNQGGPDINSHVNEWYLGYWSLVHFLLHGQNGKYESGFRKLLAGPGATVEDFERDIGPIAQVEPEWYRYLRDLQAGDGTEPGEVVTVPDSAEVKQ